MAMYPRVLAAPVLTAIAVAVFMATQASGSPMNIDLSAPIFGIVASPDDSPLKDIFAIGETATISLTYDPDAPEDSNTVEDLNRGDFIDPSIAFTLTFPDTGLSFVVSGSSMQTISTINDLDITDEMDVIVFSSDSISTVVSSDAGGSINGMLDGRTPDAIGLIFSDIEEPPILPDMLTTDALPPGPFEPRFAGITFSYVLSVFPTPTVENLILNLDFNAEPGSSPDSPILPDEEDDGVFVFIGVPSGTWIDPPTATGFDYEMTGDSLFTNILAFPPSFDGPFEVLVGDVSLGNFAVDESVAFAEFSTLLDELLVDGIGVQAFTVTGITPPVDPEDPTAFPIQLDFSTDTADLNMTPIPEPGASVVIALLGLPLISWRGVQKH